MTPVPGKSRILVICTASLARFVPALGAMAAIRAVHQDAHIVLLTQGALVEFAATAPYFDDVWGDETVGRRHLGTLRALQRRLRSFTFDAVYDFDDSAHARRLFWMMYG